MTLSVLFPLVLKASIILNVFGLGLGAAPQDLICVVRKPALLARSLLSMNILMPLVATLLAARFALLPPVKIALIALAVSPVPPLLPRRMIRAGGESAYAFGLLISAALFSIVWIPVVFAAIEPVFGVSLYEPFAAVAGLVVMTVVAPLGAGALVHKLAPGFADRLARIVLPVALVLLIGVIVPVLFRTWPDIVSLVGNGTLAALAALVLAGLAAGHFLGEPAPGHRTVLALATAVRHPAIAVAIAQANFPGQTLVPPAVVLYLLLSFVLVTPYIMWRRAHAPDQINNRIVA